MIKNPSFYSVIIGSELLNGRREDEHFRFLNSELTKRGFEQKANFVIKDDPKFIEDIFNLIKKDPNSVMFSFGGIGSTPDDFTREVAAKVFTNQELVVHDEAKKIIIDRLDKRAYPHPIKMAHLPKGAKLLANPVNKMPGFFLHDRYFFTPGFPDMAKPMVIEALDKFYPKAQTKYSCNFIVYSGEASLIDIMQKLPPDIELSCLPGFDAKSKFAEIYLASFDQDRLKKWAKFFKQEIKSLGIEFTDIATF